MDSSFSNPAALIILAIICIAVINFLVLAKFSFARLRAEHVADEDSLSPESRAFLQRLYKKPELFINTIQFTNLFFIVVLAGLVRLLVTPLLEELFSRSGYDGHYAPVIAVIISIAILAMIVLIIGEIIPKALGLSYPLRYIRFTASVVVIIGKLVYPFVWISMKVANLLLRGTPYRTEVDLVHTEEELRVLVNRSHLKGELDQVEGELIDNVFDFVERRAREVMIPRQDVDCLYVEDSFEETMKIVAETSHTRYPLCMEDKDHIIGFIHIKDLMEHRDVAEHNICRLRRDILTVPEVMKLSVLLQYMRSRRIYQAIVVDEYGGMVGLVGLEDIIEELVGDIQDEHETELPAILANEDGSFSFAGTVLVDDVEDAMKVQFDNAEEDTIGGYIFSLLGRTPEIGDTVESEGCTFTVTEVQGYRITRLEAIPSASSEDELDGEEQE